MYKNQKIGVGIVTYNRKPGLLKLYQSLPRELIDALIVVNDGDGYSELDTLDCVVHHNESNQGVGCSKNTALRYLLSQNVDHYFLIEDDIFIKDPSVFYRYIELSQKTGIQHFNFSQHGPLNRLEDGTPRYQKLVEYEGFSMPLFPACVGAFCYYSAHCLETVGLMDEFYYNAMEHIDHTMLIVKAGMHPAWYFFPDLHHSEDYLGDEGWTLEQSTHAGNPTYRARVKVANAYFHQKHGELPKELLKADFDVVKKQLKLIQQRYAVS